MKRIEREQLLLDLIRYFNARRQLETLVALDALPERIKPARQAVFKIGKELDAQIPLMDEVYADALAALGVVKN